MVAATRAELEKLGKLDTMFGQQALRLAEKMSGYETASGMASLSRELREIVAELGRQGASPKGAGQKPVGDAVDDLRARRDAKLGKGVA